MTSYPPPPESEGPRDQPDSPYPTYQSYAQSAGSVPGYPPGGDAVATVDPPPSIVRAVMLMRVGAGLSLVSMLVGLLTLSTVKDNIRNNLINNANFTESDVNTFYTIFIVSTIIGGIISIALWLWMAHTNGAGRKWARIVATVFGVLAIVSFLAGLAQAQQTGAGVGLSALTAILAVVILILLWRKESSAYYDASSRPKYS